MLKPPAFRKDPKTGVKEPLVMFWPYLTELGEPPFGYVARYQGAGGKNVIPHFVPNGIGGFGSGSLPDPRPLFGLDTLSRLTPIWIVEGEKAAAALHAIGLAAVTSQGGAQSGHLGDWVPVRRELSMGRAVFIWPDNDAPGRAYAATVARLIGTGYDCLLSPPAGTPDVKGADAADWLTVELAAMGIAWDGLNPLDLTEDHRRALSGALTGACYGIVGEVPQEWTGHNGHDKPMLNPRAFVRAMPEPAGPIQWPEPEPLPAGLPPVAVLDPRSIPGPFRAWIGDIADRMQCPPDYPAVAVLVCLATVVGRQLGIRPKQRDDWTVTPNLWGAVIGRPSLLKTPAIQEPMKMIESLEAASRERHEAAQRDYLADLMVKEAAAKMAKEKIVKAMKAGDANLAHAYALEATEADEPPARKRYLTQDVTVEKLGELLRDNPRGALVYRDELIGFLRGLDKEGREGSRAFFLEAWNGTGRFTFDRIGRGTVEIEAACISIIGGIQPGPLGSYLVSALSGGAADDGLMQRFQLAVWPDALDDWRNVDRWPDTDARRTARGIFERLDAIDAHALGAVQEEGDGLPWLRFDGEAQEGFDDWRGDLERRLRGDDMHPAMESHLAKYRSLVPSLALLFHMADNPQPGRIGISPLLLALAWAKYLESHARRIYAPALDPGMAAARELDRRLAKLPESFTARDVSQRAWRMLDREGTAAALAVLVEYGRIREEGPTDTGPGRPTTRYAVNPALR